jgi:tetratricopeptide (TPR) repeat protein
MAIDLDPSYSIAYGMLGRADEQLGRMPEGITAYQTAIEGDSTNAEHWANLGHAYAVSGRPADARRILADLKTSSSKGYVSPYWIALIHAGLGDKDQALAWFERAVDDRSSLPPLYYNDGRWDKLCLDPRWAALMKRIGLTATGRNTAAPASRGSRGFATAEDLRHGRKVAIKVLHPNWPPFLAPSGSSPRSGSPPPFSIPTWGIRRAGSGACWATAEPAPA